MRVLLVEDEEKLTQALAYLLRKEEIDVDVANDGETGLLSAQRNMYDVIVLDIMLPGINGLEILKAIRKEANTTPVLMLTARDAIEDRVKGLESGADDYLVKPFATVELIARIRSLARRAGTKYSTGKLSMGNIEYTQGTYLLKIDGRRFDLTAKEGRLLEMFLKQPGQVFTREQILDRIWGFDADILVSNVEIYIHHLRKKLNQGANVEIKTVRNVGYMLKER